MVWNSIKIDFGRLEKGGLVSDRGGGKKETGKREMILFQEVGLDWSEIL